MAHSTWQNVTVTLHGAQHRKLLEGGTGSGEPDGKFACGNFAAGNLPPRTVDDKLDQYKIKAKRVDRFEEEEWDARCTFSGQVSEFVPW